MEIKLGGPLYTALKKVLDIRNQRREKYGDSWRDVDEYRLLAMVMEKADRLEMNFKSGNTDYEGKEDTLIDIINWALFYLQNMEDGRIK